MRRALKIVRAALVFTGFYVGGALTGLFLFPLIALFSRDADVRTRRVRRTLTAAFRMTIDILRWGGFFTFDSRSVPAPLADHPVIGVVNHPTTIDVVAVLSIYRDVVVVVKHKIWTHPLLRWVFRWCGHIDGGDGSMEANVALMDAVEAALRGGQTVVVWPEGTRSPPRGLGPMQRGAFSAAIRTGTPILPVIIEADPPVLHKEQPWYVWPPEPVRYRVRVGSELSPLGHTTRSLQRAVVATFYAELGIGGEPAPSDIDVE